MNYAPELIGVGRFTGELGKYLADQGHRVEVVTAPPHYPGWRIQPPFKQFRYEKQTLGGATVFRTPIWLANKTYGIRRLVPPLVWAFLAAPVVLWRALHDDTHVVIAVEPTLFAAPAALLAAKLSGARTILHVQDLEIDAAFAVGHMKSGFLKRFGAAFERFLLKRFDQVVTISERMAERLAEKGVARDRLTVIRNWVDLKSIQPLGRENPFRAELGLGAQDFVALYAGQMGRKQSLPLLFEAVEGTKLHLVVAGDGPAKAELVARYGTASHVHFLPLQPEERLPELLALADAHLLPQDAKASDLVLPSKLAGQLASGKPIVATAERGSELFALLDGVAHLTPPSDATAMRTALLALKDGRAQSEAAPRIALAAELFSRETNLGAFERLIVGGRQAEAAVAEEVAA